jgi:hypothetical protein
MKVICIDDRDCYVSGIIKPIKGHIYEATKKWTNIDKTYYRWEIEGQPHSAYYDYRFKEFKCAIPNNIRVI